VPADPGEGLPLAPGASLDPSEVTWRFSTAGGPGGQHVNTSNTRAEASFDVASATLPAWARDRIRAALGDVVTVTAGDTRSQARNRALALTRLAGRLRAALVEPTERRATRPSRASQRRRVEAKRRHGEVKRERRRRPNLGDD
jgi:ribosome-associated protein